MAAINTLESKKERGRSNEECGANISNRISSVSNESFVRVECLIKRLSQHELPLGSIENFGFAKGKMPTDSTFGNEPVKVTKKGLGREAMLQRPYLDTQTNVRNVIRTLLSKTPFSFSRNLSDLRSFFPRKKIRIRPQLSEWDFPSNPSIKTSSNPIEQYNRAKHHGADGSKQIGCDLGKGKKKKARYSTFSLHKLAISFSLSSLFPRRLNFNAFVIKGRTQ